MYVCMYVCMYVSMYVSMYIFDLCTYLVCMYLVYLHIYVNMNELKNKCADMYVRILEYQCAPLTSHR